MTNRQFQPTVSEWETEFARSRSRRPLGETSEQIVQCRRRFGEISATVRRHRRERRLDHPLLEALQKISHDCLLLIRLAHQELTAFDRPSSPIVTPELLDRLLNAAQSRLQTIDAQLLLIDSTFALAESLRPVIEGVVSEDGFPVRRLESLLHRLELGKWNGQSDQWIPSPGVCWEHLLRDAGWPDSWFYASAVHSARWVAAVCRVMTEDDPYPIRCLIAAALLSDLGLLVTTRARQGTLRRSDPQERLLLHRHPELSAAMISGLRGASPEWAFLARIHHERLDGSGFPSRLSDRQLSPVARGFTAAMRWAELLLQSSTAADAEDTLFISSQALWRETQRGAFDPGPVTRLLSVVYPGRTASLSPGNPSDALLLLDPAHGLTGPHDMPGAGAADVSRRHGSVATPSPQFLRLQQRRVARRG